MYSESEVRVSPLPFPFFPTKTVLPSSTHHSRYPLPSLTLIRHLQLIPQEHVVMLLSKKQWQDTLAQLSQLAAK